MSDVKNKALKTLSLKNILLPVLIGIGVSFYLIYREFDNISIGQFKGLLDAKLGWVIAAILVLIIRDFGYMSRLKFITFNQLSWKSSFLIIMLWEFSSAVTPSAVGGTAVAIFLLHKEGISLAKSIAFVIVTALFDNLFFLVASGTIFLFKSDMIFPDVNMMQLPVGTTLQYLFGLSYILVLTYSFIMMYGLFFKPRGLKWIIIRIFNLKFLRKWKHSGVSFADDIISASGELKHTKLNYWLTIGGLTLFVWIARYFLVNCLIAAFYEEIDHLLIIARHCVMWVTILVAPTPGGSGLAELSFRTFFGEFLHGNEIGVLLFWRMMTYWLYLLLGAIILPFWLSSIKKRETI